MIADTLPELFAGEISQQNREPDGLLHPSGDLIGSLRHTQLKAAGAPETPNELASQIRLLIGTLQHEWFQQTLVKKGVAVMSEVKLTEGLPEGWSGTADALVWNREAGGFELVDYKTIKPEGISWVERGGAKDEHIFQCSAYFWAAVEMGLPMVSTCSVMYWPTGAIPGVEIRPTVQHVEPLPREVIWGRMEARWEATQAYLSDMAVRTRYVGQPATSWLSEALSPVQDRVQKLFWNKGQGVYDLKLVPHWSAAYCAFPAELCGCKEQGSTKIGEYDLNGTYTARSGYEETLPTEAPTEGELKKRRKGVSSE